ncbi:MAG TPA: hypothetical protein VET48_05675, partial [Steroidobacteraceae bacterium]|nr:hypothetical protein [Steroidobacteraceae bacterium]
MIGVDFPLGFPNGFMVFLASKVGVKDHDGLVKKIREDLKKNTDDGIRKWIDLMGEYRETKTESAEEAQARFSINNKKPVRGRLRELPVHERRTMIERFRRIDRIIRRQFPDAVASTLGIQYNRLTRRYEFVSANARGRTTLVGISLLEQVREAKPEVAIWPFEKPKDITVVETFPKLFEERLAVKPDELRTYFDHEEDNGLHVAK